MIPQLTKYCRISVTWTSSRVNSSTPTSLRTSLMLTAHCWFPSFTTTPKKTKNPTPKTSMTTTSRNLSPISTFPCLRTGQLVQLQPRPLVLHLNGLFLLLLVPRWTPPIQTRICHHCYPISHLTLVPRLDLSLHLIIHRQTSLLRDLVSLHPQSTKPSADPIVRQSQRKGKSRVTPKREEDQRQAAKLWSYIPVQVCTRRLHATPPHSLLPTSLALSRKPCRPRTRHNGPPPSSKRWVPSIDTVHTPLYLAPASEKSSDHVLHSRSRMPRRPNHVSRLDSSPKATRKLRMSTSKKLLLPSSKPPRYVSYLLTPQGTDFSSTASTLKQRFSTLKSIEKFTWNNHLASNSQIALAITSFYSSTRAFTVSNNLAVSMPMTKRRNS